MEANIVRLRMFARQDAATASVAPRSSPTRPAGRVALSTERRVSDLTSLVAGLDSPDPNVRRLVLSVFNDRARMISDTLLGTSSISLSSPSLFPDMENAGIPTAVMLTDGDRQVVDTRWVNLYQTRDYRQSNNPFFKIGDVFHNITVKQYQQGERVEFGFVEAEERILETQIYGTALQWSRYFSRFTDKWTRAMGMAAMQTKSLNAMAQRGYDTITGAVGIPTTAYDTVGTTTSEKDINTLNTAMQAIRSALFNATSTVGGTTLEEEILDTTPFYLLYNPDSTGYTERIAAALSVRYGLVQRGSSLALKELNHPIIPISSQRVTAGFWFMTVPLRKNVFAVHMDQTFFDITDVRVAGLTEGEIGWEFNRFEVDDVNALRKISTS